MLRIIALALTCAFSIYAQTTHGAAVNISTTPPAVQTTEFIFLDGSNNTEYVCSALRNQRTKTWTYANSEITNIVDSGTTATITFASDHGFDTTRSVGMKITIAGASDTDLNGDYFIQSVPSTTTATVTSANVTDATYTTGVSVSTTAPRLTEPIWTITKMVFDTTYLTAKRTSNPNSICNNRAVTTGATTVFYQ